MARRRQVATIGFADEGLSGQFESLRASVTEVESWLDGMSTEEYISSLIDRINTEVNATGGYTYIVEGIGLRTYDVAVTDPAVGTEANAVVEMRGGTIRIANTKDAQGNWEWKTVFTSGHIAGELVTAAQIITGYIGSAGGTYIDLDNNFIQLGESSGLHLTVDPSGINIYDGSNMVGQFLDSQISLSPVPESGQSTASIQLFGGQGELICTFGTTRSDVELAAGRVYIKGYDRAMLQTSYNLGAHLDLNGDYLELELPDVVDGNTKQWTIYGSNQIISGPGRSLDINQTLDFHVYSSGNFDSQDYVARIRPANTGGNLGIWLNEVGTTNVVHYLLNNGTGRLLYRTSSDGGTTWSSQKGVRSPWTSLGSFTGSNYLTIDLTDYDELMVVAKFSGKVFAANLPKAALTTNNQEWWLSGGKDETTSSPANGAGRVLVNVRTTRVTGVAANNGSSNVLSSTTFTVYAR